jgi:hypothetical protein
VTLARSGANNADLSFVMPDGGRVTVEKWLSGSAYQLAEVRFANGTVWTKADVNAMKAAIQGTESADSLTGTSSNPLFSNYNYVPGSGTSNKVWDLKLQARKKEPRMFRNNRAAVRVLVIIPAGPESKQKS